jgi:hypothetical protein
MTVGPDNLSNNIKLEAKEKLRKHSKSLINLILHESIIHTFFFLE